MSTQEQTTEYSPSDAAPALWPAPQRTVLVTMGRFVVMFAAMFVIGVARWLAPSPTGVGTHTQLFLPPCGFKTITGLPCPSCGMTTAFAYMAHLQLARGFSAQPFGAALFLAVVATALAALYSAVFDKSLTAIASRVFTWRRGVFIAVAFALVWLVQIVRTLAAR